MSKLRVAHTVTISAKGCDTSRTCFCLATNGREHHEYDSPWVVDHEGHYERSSLIEPPPDPPMYEDEDLEEYEYRLHCASAWAKGNTQPSGHPNPHLTSKEEEPA